MSTFIPNKRGSVEGEKYKMNRQWVHNINIVRENHGELQTLFKMR